MAVKHKRPDVADDCCKHEAQYIDSFIQPNGRVIPQIRYLAALIMLPKAPRCSTPEVGINDFRGPFSGTPSRPQRATERREAGEICLTDVSIARRINT
jgi:hypothetical protein